MSGKVVVIGSINVDDVLPVASWPQPGETVLLAGPPSTGLGGKGANQAVAAALAGAEVSFVGAVGEDAGGSRALETLRGHGVDVTAVRAIPGIATGRATILVNADGENIILVDPGANAEVGPADVVAARALFAAADVVLAQGEVPRAAIEEAAALCRETGTRFVLNLAPPIEVAPDVLTDADPLIVNELEARHLDIDPSAPELGALRTLVVTRGGEGVTAVTAAGTDTVPAHRVEPVDTTGAGDAFAGTLCAALAAGRPLADACRAGSAAGAYAVTRPGASTSYGSTDDIRRFLARS